MFTAAVTPIVHVLPRLHLVGDGVRVVSKNANSDCIVLGRGCSVNRIKSRVLIAERNEPLVAHVGLVQTAVAPEEVVVLAEPRLQPRRELVRGDLLGFRLRPSEDALLLFRDQRVHFVALVVGLREHLSLVDERVERRLNVRNGLVDRRVHVVEHQPSQILGRRWNCRRLVQQVQRFRHAHFPRIFVAVEGRNQRVVEHLLNPQRHVGRLLDEQVEQLVPRDGSPSSADAQPNLVNND